MSPQEVIGLFKNIFSENGVELNGFKIKSKSPMSIHISYKPNGIEILFPNNKPKASFKRLITISVNVERITLNETGGYIKLEYFPEFSFGYEKIFGEYSGPDICLEDIQSDINAKYRGKDKEIASLCLQYANDWATIASQGECFAGTTEVEKVFLHKQCLKYVKENVRKDIEKKYGSVILTYLLVFIIIPAIARFIVIRLLDKYF